MKISLILQRLGFASEIVKPSKIPCWNFFLALETIQSHQKPQLIYLFFLQNLQVNVQNLPADMDLDIAIIPPPPGVASNFDNPESRAYETVIVFTIYLIFMMSIFLLRIYSNVFITRSLGWDDCKSQDP